MTKVATTRVQRRRHQKFNQMLDHAMRLIIDDGFTGFTMRSLANSLDITAGALYRYFPSKGHIIGALGNRTLRLYSETIQSSIEKAQADFQEYPEQQRSLLTVGALAKGYFSLSLESYEHFRILNMIMIDEQRYMTNPSDYTLFMEGSVQLLRQTAEQYDLATKKKAICVGDGLSRALMLLTILNGSLQMLKFGQEMPNVVNPSDIFSLTFANHLLGLKASKEDVDIVLRLLYSG